MIHKVHLRQATPDDFEFLYQVHREAMRDYVERTWGWNEECQQQYFREHFDPDEYQIVVYRGEDVGMMAVDRRGGEIHLNKMALRPAFQGRGLGTYLINRVLDEARGKMVWLQVLKVNPARRLYERIGFTIAGETVTHYTMRREGTR
jgi:GNAT superfamily N-acetyltransferase